MTARCACAAGFPISLCLAISTVYAAAPPTPPPAVVVATVQDTNVAPVYSFIGHVIAIQSVAIVPRVTAFIEAEPFTQGSIVKKGQTLFELQKTQYQASLQSAQAALDSANATVVNAQLAYDRASKLSTQGFEAQSNLDQALATLKQDKANVLNAQAGVAQAALNLSYTTIVSPIDGQVGPVTLTPGNLVTPSTPALATVNQIDPIRVVFSISDSVLVKVQQKNGSSPGKIATDVVVDLKLPDGSSYDQTGKIAFFNNEVDPQTGTVSVYTDFSNPNSLLLPGSYVTAEVHSAAPVISTLVPVAAVQTLQNGKFVLTVDSSDIVHQQAVTLGRQIAQDFIVTEGLKPGDRVIVQGVQKVHAGEKVTAQAAPPPPTSETTASAATTPGN